MTILLLSIRYIYNKLWGVKMKQISVRFPEEFLEEIDTIAKIEYTDRTALMKKALRRYITMELEEGKLKEIVVRRYLGSMAR